MKMFLLKRLRTSVVVLLRKFRRLAISDLIYTEKWEHLMRQNMRRMRYNTKQKRHILESRLPASIVMILRCCRLSLADLVSFVDKWEQRTTNVEAQTTNADDEPITIRVKDQTGDETNDEPITIRVKDQTGDETMFKIKQSTKMSKVFTAYAQRISVDMKSLRFFFDGERIKDTDTPDLLELEDGGQIDCVFQQVGGGDNDDGGYNKENVKPTMKTNKHRRVSNQQSQKSKKHRRNESNVSDSMNENETIQMNMSTKKQKEKLPVSVSSLNVIVRYSTS
jgi:small ubiquitin-related modifier